MAADKQHAHELIDQLPPSQVAAAIGILQRLLESPPAAGDVPVDDEPEGAEERRAVAKSKAWFRKRSGKGIPHEEVLAEFGVTPNDLKNK